MLHDEKVNSIVHVVSRVNLKKSALVEKCLKKVKTHKNGKNELSWEIMRNAACTLTRCFKIFIPHPTDIPLSLILCFFTLNRISLYFTFVRRRSHVDFSSKFFHRFFYLATHSNQNVIKGYESAIL